MAIEKNIKINVDTTQAVKDTDKLTKSFKEVDQQSEKTSKSIDDVAGNGGAIAILDQLTGGLATRFKDAYEATKLFNGSLKGMRTALIATGIGAFAVAVGLVVTYWDDIVDFVTQANEKLEEQKLLIEKNIEKIDADLKLNKLIETSLIAQGKSTEAILKQRDELLQKKQADLLLSLQALRLEREKAILNAEELSFWETLYNLKQKFTGQQETTSIIDAEEQVEIDALNKSITDITASLVELATLRATLAGEDIIPNKEKRTKEVQEDVGNGLSFEDNLTLGSKELLNDKLASLDEDFKAGQSARDKAQLNEAKANAQREIEYREGVKEASVGLANATLGALGSLAKEGSAIAKGTAVAQAVMNTYQGITKSLAESTDPTPTQSFRIGSAVAVGAFGLAQVAKILSTKPVETTAPSTGGGSRPSAPSFNLVQGSATNQIAQSVQTGTQPTRAFVVSSDVTSQQSLDRRIEEGSTL
jgi:hypothetical protein